MKVFLALAIVLAMVLVAESKLTNKDRKSFLKSINKLRSQVAKGKVANNQTGANLPKASKMNQLVWSKSLEKLALKLISSCNFIFSSGMGRYKVLTGNVSTSVLLSNATTFWSEQFAKYGYSADLIFNGTKFFEYDDDGYFGMYSYAQAIWGSSSRVGCESFSCASNSTTLICAFSGVGTLEGEKIYKTGKKQKCGKGRKAIKKTRLCKAKGKKGRAIQK
ncbi:SCP-like protein [Aphelenchoides bicaudatus]|nr:SCP-like protein [Aphelenchoides bicaudatus]